MLYIRPHERRRPALPSLTARALQREASPILRLGDSSRPRAYA